MKMKINIAVILFSFLLISSCKEDTGDYKEIMNQRTGDFKVSVLNEKNVIKEGTGVFVLEFRNAANNELVKVENIKTDAVMQMSGNPMSGETAISDSGKPGRYNVKYKLNMKGNWNFVVTFNNNQRVQFVLNVM